MNDEKSSTRNRGMHSRQAVSPRPLSSSTSPLSTNFPSVLTPATPSMVNKALAPMPGSVQMPTISLNKTWVLPPKPKPGRKPAVDTPPTKRKAQNREAQRAFRERRAAKVSELEEEMKKLEEEDAREQDVLREKIQHLESNVEEYSRMVFTWRERFNEMQMACMRERQIREQAEMEVDRLKRAMIGGTEAVALPSRRKNYDQDFAESTSGLADENPSNMLEQAPMTCGRCNDDTRCQCIEEAFEMGDLGDNVEGPAIKRPHSPQSTTDNKRSRLNEHGRDDQEIDFTAQFSSNRPPALTTSASTSSSVAAVAPPDPCGFCQDGSPCICAELTKDKLRYSDYQQVAPLPSKSNQTTNGTTSSDPCAGGPGTCVQCRADPMSTLFCKSVANNQPSTSMNSSSIKDGVSRDAPSTSVTITCADAYTALSRHPGFPAATNELNTWVPQLTPVAKASTVPERTAFDIEAASVMSVLKLFDRRFNSQGNGTGESDGGKSHNMQNGASNVDDTNGETIIAYEEKKPEK